MQHLCLKNMRVDEMNKVAVITGASKGIGKSIAISLAKENYSVVINYRNEARSDLAESVAEECRKYGAEAEIFRADVSSENDCAALAAFAKERFGRIDVLVNNAGVANYTLLTRIKEDEYRNTVGSNQDSVLFMMKHVCKIMKKQKSGRIINIASMAGVSGFAGGTLYSATKGAVIALTKAASKELAYLNITVNAVAPGMIDTGMDKVIDASQSDKIISHIGMRRYGTPEEVAGAVVYLASDIASYVTGTVIEIHGALEN